MKYEIVIQGERYAIIIEKRFIDATHYCDAIAVDLTNGNYYEALQVLNPKEIKATGILTSQNSENQTLDEIILKQVRVWNYKPMNLNKINFNKL
ncbi:MAG: hypothetical protein ACJAVA_000308 [Flavobacteriaceae bacterium]|jgi:hypothetical protein